MCRICQPVLTLYQRQQPESTFSRFRLSSEVLWYPNVVIQVKYMNAGVREYWIGISAG